MKTSSQPNQQESISTTATQSQNLNTMVYDSDDSETGSDEERDARLKNKFSRKEKDGSNTEIHNKVRSFFTPQSKTKFKCNICPNDKKVYL